MCLKGAFAMFVADSVLGSGVVARLAEYNIPHLVLLLVLSSVFVNLRMSLRLFICLKRAG